MASEEIDFISDCHGVMAYELVQEGINWTWEYPRFICSKCKQICREIPSDKMIWDGERWQKKL